MRASNIRNAIFSAVAIGLGLAAMPMQASANATIVIINNDAAGEGFNDPTAAAPVGGNPGTTIGSQRLNAFTHAASIWGATLDSAVPIRIRAQFDPLACSATSAVLGSAGGVYFWSDFPGAQYPGTVYSESLANKLGRVDLNPPGDPGDAFNGADLNATFNANLGNAGCLTGTFWYYGYDANEGAKIDLVAVLLHEFGHGLGFQSVVSRPSGAWIFGIPGVFDRYIHDNSTNKDWLVMTNAERATSMKNGRNVPWTGTNVTTAVPSVLTLGTPLLKVNAGAGLASSYAVGSASFGPVLSSPGLTADVVLGVDGTAPVNDACTALANVVTGKIVLVDRGTCAFSVKAGFVQAAGGVGMLVADNVADNPPAGLGGTGPTITIPSVRITQAAGAAIKAALGTSTVNVTMGLDMTRYAGADGTGRALLNMTDPVVGGSTVSHWDPIAFRNQLMEPAINADLTHSVIAPQDLTLAQMRDIGWFPDADVDGVPDASDACPGTNTQATIVIGGCNTNVGNTIMANGCSIADGLGTCASNASTHRAYTTCVANYTDQLRIAGTITAKQKTQIQLCANTANIP